MKSSSAPEPEATPPRSDAAARSVEPMEFDFDLTPALPPYATVVIPPKSSPPPKREPAAPVLHTLAVTTVEPRKSTMPTTPPTISDYRKNIERQSGEQKSFNRLLATVGYSLLAVILLVAGLAGYGGYVLWQQVQNQAATVAQVDAKYQAEVTLLRESLASKQADIDQLTELVKRQQETSNRTRATLEETSAALRTERAVRARETEEIRQRLRRVGIE